MDGGADCPLGSPASAATDCCRNIPQTWQLLTSCVGHFYHALAFRSRLLTAHEQSLATPGASAAELVAATRQGQARGSRSSAVNAGPVGGRVCTAPDLQRTADASGFQFAVRHSLQSSVKMGRLTGCCCCFNLRDGAKAVGIVHLVLGSLAVVCQFVVVGVMAQRESGVAGGEIVALVLQLLATILHLVFNSLLVHGVEKNNRGMLLAWIIYSGIINGLQSLAVGIGFVLLCVLGLLWPVLLMLGVAALVGVFWYWFVVVLHCYLEMREENGFVYGKQDNEGERHAL